MELRSLALLGLWGTTQTRADWSRLRGSDLLELTKRELEVCKLLLQCKTRQEIAADLDITTRTIRQHMENIHVKLRVNNRVGIVLRIIQVRDKLNQ